MKRLVIAVDCDDVLVETGPLVARLYNDAYGTSLRLSDFYSKDPIPWGVTDIDEATERFHVLLESNHDKLKPSKSTINGVRNLAKQHELHLITGRNQLLEARTFELIRTYFDGYFASIELTNLYDEKMRRSKGEVCKRIGADVLIDDHPMHAKNVMEEAGLKEVIVFGQFPWNEGALPEGAVRCVTWDEVEKEIQRIAEK